MRNSPTSTVSLDAGATITFTGASAGASCLVPAPECVINANAGAYTIDLEPGSYNIVTSLAGYQPQTLAGVTVTGGVINNRNVQISKLASIAVTIVNTPLPTGTTVTLLDVTSPDPDSNNPPTAGVASGNTFTFTNLEPTPKRYRVVVKAAGYATQTLPSTVDHYAPVIGEAFPASSSHPLANVELAPRVVTVTVNGGTPPAGTVVSLRFGALTFTDNAAPFSFSSADLPTLPLDEVGVVRVVAPDHRGAKATAPVPSTAAIPVTISPLAVVNGTITKPAGLAALPAGTTVVASSPGMTNVEAPVTVTAGGDGTFTLEGLDNGTDGAGDPAGRDWTVSYSALRAGVDDSMVTVDSSCTATGTACPLPAITPVPRDIDVTFNVTAAEPAGSVSITLNTSTTTATPTAAGANSSPVIKIKETLIGSTISYTVTGAGYQTHSGGSITVPESLSAITEPVTVVRRPITGTVRTGGASPVPVAGASVRVCAAPPNSLCAAGTIAPDVLSAATTGSFTIPSVIPAGTYRIWATRATPTPALSGWVSLTINANGTYTLTNSTITVN